MALGYKQEFKREFSLWTTFCVSFAVLGLLPSFASTLYYGMGYAGTGGMVWGWLISWFFIQCVAMGMAELCSSMPTRYVPLLLDKSGVMLTGNAVVACIVRETATSLIFPDSFWDFIPISVRTECLEFGDWCLETLETSSALTSRYMLTPTLQMLQPFWHLQDTVHLQHGSQVGPIGARKSLELLQSIMHCPQ